MVDGQFGNFCMRIQRRKVNELVNNIVSEFQLTKNVTYGIGTSKFLYQNDLVKNAEKICVISDKGLEAAGVVDKFKNDLRKESEQVISFTDISGEPSFQLIGKAVDYLKVNQVDLVIGLGGGSALDVAKASSALFDKEDPTVYYSGKRTIENRSMKCIVLPTTSGTGSEVTKNAIFGDEVEKVKRGIVSEYLLPDLAIVDPELSVSCPARVTAASGVDAFTHAIESYISVNATIHTRIYAEKAMELFPNYITKAVHNGKDLEARAGMSWVSLLAGVSLANAGVGAVHALAYPLGGEFKVEHGVANALLMPFVFEVIGKTCTEDMVTVAKLLKLGDFSKNPYEALDVIVDYLYHLLIDLHIPSSLKELGVEEGSLTHLAKQASKIGRLLDNTPYKLSEMQILEIYRNAYRGREVKLNAN